MEVEESWPKHKIKLIQITEKYREGRDIEKKMSDSDSDFPTLSQDRRVKKKKFSDFVTLSDITEEDPQKKKKKDVLMDGIPAFPDKDEPKTNKPEDDEPSIIENPVEDDYASDSTLSVTDEQLMPPPAPLPFVQPQHRDSELEEVNHTEGCCCKHGQIINTVLKEITNLKVLVKEQSRVLDLEINLSRSSESTKITYFDTFPKKPFTSYRKLMVYEDKVKCDDQVQKQLETALYLTGGSCAKEMIRRSLSKLFCDRLARRCSWTGRKNNLPLKSLKIMDIIQTACRKHFAITQKDFEQYVSNWFRQAQLRFDRSTAASSEKAGDTNINALTVL